MGKDSNSDMKEIAQQMKDYIDDEKKFRNELVIVYGGEVGSGTISKNFGEKGLGDNKKANIDKINVVKLGVDVE